MWILSFADIQRIFDAEQAFCSKCGAWKGQLGLEPSLELYINHLLQITSELKRVLKPSGLMFWNHGDSYGGSGQSWGKYTENRGGVDKRPTNIGPAGSMRPPSSFLTPKCLSLQNHRLVLRMMDEQDWILRNMIIWHKPNGMPASVKDRFTNQYEPVFMLAKNKKYFFDLDAVRVPYKGSSLQRLSQNIEGQYQESKANEYYRNLPLTRRGQRKEIPDILKYMQNNLNHLGKNPADLWTIPTYPFPEAHYAVFPEALINPMIKAACPREVCEKCGKPRERITEKSKVVPRESSTAYEKYMNAQRLSIYRQAYREKGLEHTPPGQTIGWSDCGCNAGWRPGVVLDPFMGAGTAAVVAKKLGRNFIGIEINPEYIAIAQKRIDKVHFQPVLFE